MLSLEINEKKPISHIGDSIYTGIEKGDNVFYFCDPNECKIVEYDECFQQISCHEVKRRYTHISYCKKLGCFLAITEDRCNKVYKLNTCFEEEDCYHIETGCCMIFNGIDCKHGIVYLSTGSIIITVSIDCLNKPEIWIREEQCLSTVAKCSQYLITTMPNCCGSAIVVFDNCKCLQLACCLPWDCCIQDIKCDGHCIYILVSKCNCYNFVLICHIQLHCHEKHNREECNDIIESIALIETSLSHILNAESEKIKKVTECSNDPNLILEVNEAVNRTITNITHLEHVLYSKLEAAKCLCEKEDK